VLLKIEGRVFRALSFEGAEKTDRVSSMNPTESSVTLFANRIRDDNKIVN
jgi:hypothetical protein